MRGTLRTIIVAVRLRESTTFKILVPQSICLEFCASFWRKDRFQNRNKIASECRRGPTHHSSVETAQLKKISEVLSALGDFEFYCLPNQPYQASSSILIPGIDLKIFFHKSKTLGQNGAGNFRIRPKS